MKRIIATLLALMLLMSMTACGGTQQPAVEATPELTVEPTAEPTPEPAPTEPVWEPGLARAKWGEAIYEVVELDTEVQVIGKLSNYYIVAGEEVDLLVDERMVRLASEDAFEAWTGYTYEETKVYSDAYMDGEVIEELGLNTEVNVVEGKANWLRIEWEDKYGYVDVEDISENYIVYYYGGGGGGGAADGTDVSLGGLSAIVGTNPQFSKVAAYCGPEYEKLDEKAVAISHDTRLYLFLTDRGETIKVTEIGEEVCTIYIEGFYAELPRWLLWMEGDVEYEAWTGYAQSGTIVYDEYQMRNEFMELRMNDEVLVIDELPMCYVVDINGQIGYVHMDDISESYIVPYYGGGGGGGGAWTPPQL